MSYFHRPSEPVCQREGCGEVLQRIRPHPRYWPQERLRLCGEPCSSERQEFLWVLPTDTMSYIFLLFAQLIIIIDHIMWSSTTLNLYLQTINGCIFFFLFHFEWNLSRCHTLFFGSHSQIDPRCVLFLLKISVELWCMCGPFDRCWALESNITILEMPVIVYVVIILKGCRCYRRILTENVHY